MRSRLRVFIQPPKSTAIRTPPMARALPRNEAVDLAIEQANAVAAGPALPSLEMKEFVDFLATPGLLLERSLQPDTTVGYPEE